MQEGSRFNLRHRERAVATYLQTFVLIAVAIGGSSVAYRVVSAYAYSVGGPLITVLNGSLQQDSGVAVERLTVSDSGQTSFPYFLVLNPGLRDGGSFCYSVTSPAGSIVTQTCPLMDSDPTSIMVNSSLTPGSTVVVAIVLKGAGVFTPGDSYPYFVTAPDAAEAGGVLVAEQG